jgi:hypothetical protein
VNFNLNHNTKMAVAYVSIAQVVSAGLAFKAHPLLMIVNATAIALAIIVLEVMFELK